MPGEGFPGAIDTTAMTLGELRKAASQASARTDAAATGMQPGLESRQRKQLQQLQWLAGALVVAVLVACYSMQKGGTQ